MVATLLRSHPLLSQCVAVAGMLSSQQGVRCFQLTHVVAIRDLLLQGSGAGAQHRPCNRQQAQQLKQWQRHTHSSQHSSRQPARRAFGLDQQQRSAARQ